VFDGLFEIYFVHVTNFSAPPFARAGLRRAGAPCATP
jgi:hypothetical protein